MTTEGLWKTVGIFNSQLNNKLTLWDLYQDQGWTFLLFQRRMQHLHRDVVHETNAHTQLCRLLRGEACALLPAMLAEINTLNFSERIYQLT